MTERGTGLRVQGMIRRWNIGRPWRARVSLVNAETGRRGGAGGPEYQPGITGNPKLGIEVRNKLKPREPGQLLISGGMQDRSPRVALVCA